MRLRKRPLAERLLDDYNRYWFETHHIRQRRASGAYLRSLKATEERLELFAGMVKWCRAQEIDPRIWLYILFRARAWRFPPKIETGSLQTENPKMHALYREIGGLDAYRRATTERPRAISVYDPNRDLNPTVEVLKARYVEAGEAASCIALMVERTLGFHPRSEVCERCPVAAECSARLQEFADFDIMALRLGHLTSEAAMAQTRRVASARAKIRKAVLGPAEGAPRGD